MLTTHNYTHAPSHRFSAALLKLTLFLLIALAGGLILVVSASAQSFESANTNAGSIQGIAVDSNNDPVPHATVALQGPDGNRLTVVTKDDGAFSFHNVTPGVSYKLTITAEGLSDWDSSIAVEPGEDKTLTDIKLRTVAVHRAVTVTYSSKEVAAQQLKAEEHQRVLGFIPNLYVTYEPHPEPLTSKMKFHLAYKSLTNPYFFGRTVAWAGVQQARDNPSEWQQGAKGYSKRLGAGFADAVTGGLISNAILPSLLHQDPRYFYQGTGTKKSRALHAMWAPFVCKGDNGAWQPNYSQLGGS